MRSTRVRIALFVLLAVGVLPLVGVWADQLAQTKRPASWGVAVERPGLPNLHKITDNLYRGAQPTEEGFQELEKIGIKTVVNLRNEKSPDRKFLKKTKLRYEHIPMDPSKVTAADIAAFLKIAVDPERQPVFFHCHAGADRTGTMCAAYRVVVQGWSKKAAIDEMVNGGYHFHPYFTNLPVLIRSLDVEKMRESLGVKPPVQQPQDQQPETTPKKKAA